MSSLSPIAEAEEGGSSTPVWRKTIAPARNPAAAPPSDATRNSNWRSTMGANTSRDTYRRIHESTYSRTGNSHTFNSNWREKGQVSAGQSGQTVSKSAAGDVPGRPGRAGSTDIGMSVGGYVRAVERLANQEPTREHGGWTVDDPRIIWLCQPQNHPTGRVAAIERICREACRTKNTSIIWVRWGDHSTTRTLSVTAQNRIARTVGADDPHITVYMGNSVEYDYEGHLYVVYAPGSQLPGRLAEPSERKFYREGQRDAAGISDRRTLRDKARGMGYLPLRKREVQVASVKPEVSSSSKKPEQAIGKLGVDTGVNRFDMLAIVSPGTPVAASG